MARMLWLLVVQFKRINGKFLWIKNIITGSIFRTKNEIYSLIDYKDTNQYIESAIEKMALPNSMLINGIVVNLENVSGCEMTEGMIIRWS